MKTDKIINNSFNEGETGYQEFTVGIKLDSKISSLYDDQLGDVIMHRARQIMNDAVYKIFEDCPWHEKYKNPKRVDKTDMVKMYYYFKERIMKIQKFSNMEMFIGFAEFFQINYDQLYGEVGVLDKEALLKEMSESMGMKDRIKTKRLF